jgi:hypothetical protein
MVDAAAATKHRIEIEVDGMLVGHIRNCLVGTDAEDFTVSPIISGWGTAGYWSSEHTFSAIGKRVIVRFTADPVPLKQLLATGFGILAMDIIPISVSKLAA